MCTKQPLLEPTRPITFKQVSAGFVCDSGRPRFRFWESPPSASWRGQMVRLVQTGSGSLGLKMNQWLNYHERETQKSAAERSESEDASCVFLAAEPDPATALWLFFVSWNETFAVVWSTALAKLRFGTQAAFMTFDFSFSCSSFLWQHQTVCVFLLSVLWRKASSWHCYYVRLYPEHPRNAQAESPLKYLCLTDRRRLLACWWMLGPRVTDTCPMICQLLLRWRLGK